MRNKDGYTPKEAAVEITLGWLRAAYQEATRDVDNLSTTKNGEVSERFKRELRKHLALIHNKMLQGSTLDGVPLDEAVGGKP